MNLKQIKVDHWYQTDKGDGKCLCVIGGNRLQFNIVEPPVHITDAHERALARGIVYLSSSEVQYEIAKGQEPQQLPGEEKPDDQYRWCPHCKKPTKHVDNEPPPTVCWHCGKDLLVTLGKMLRERLPRCNCAREVNPGEVVPCGDPAVSRWTMPDGTVFTCCDDHDQGYLESYGDRT